MKITKFISILAIFTISSYSIQAQRKNALLVAEYQKNYEGIGNYAHLVSYNFIDGKLHSKDTIISASTIKGKQQAPSIRYGFGRGFIYKNRYVVSGTGNVIDIETKSLVMEESDTFIETRSDSIIFHRKNIYTGTGFLVCDLKSRTYGFVEDKKFLNTKGMQSPNHLFGIEIDQSEFPYKIVLFDSANNKEVLVNDCGVGTSLSPSASTFSYIPTHWIDNQNFLYANYTRSYAEKGNKTATAIIHKFNIETKKSKIITTIDAIPLAVSNSSFATNPENKIIFHCAKGQFEIDIDEKQAILYNMSSIGSDFSIENNRNETYGRIITFEKTEIGRVWCKYYNAKTASGFIGVEYGDVGSNLGYPKGVKVWNNISKKWIEIEIPWIAGIIGWIEK